MTTDDIPSDGNGDNTAAELERLTAELAQKSAELDQREESLRRMEDDALERDGVLATREAALAAQLVEASAREAAVGEREAVADADFAQQRVALTAELGQQRDAAQQEVNTWQVTRHAQVDAELDALFQRRLSEVTAEIDAQRESLRAVIAAERAVWDAELAGREGEAQAPGSGRREEGWRALREGGPSGGARPGARIARGLLAVASGRTGRGSRTSHRGPDAVVGGARAAAPG